MKRILLNAFAFIFATVFLHLPNFANANEETLSEKAGEIEDKVEDVKK